VFPAPLAVLVAAVVLLLVVRPASAHRMDHAVAPIEAQVVTLSYPFGAPPMFEPYRVYAPESDVAFQTGRTDRLGRVSFVPDRPGEWRVVIATEDGHGTTVVVPVDDETDEVAKPATPRGGFAMTVAGVGYLLGAAGALMLWRQRNCR
jgi:nickel transport protein